MEKYSCRKCLHFYITWERKHPYGCRGFGMKSRQFPGLLVRNTSGEDCHMYKSKKKTELRSRNVSNG